MENKKPKQLTLGVNLIRRDETRYSLPNFRDSVYNVQHVQDGDTVELIILDDMQFSVANYERPLRYGKYYGNRIFLNTCTDSFSVNPKFVYDSNKMVWVLMNVGYVCFSEVELEYKTNHKRYGEVDA